jgi:hypothetical protein
MGQTAGPAMMGVALALLGSTLAFIWVAMALLALGWWLSMTGPGTSPEHQR